MLSRVADSLYWMARYLERAENTTRMIDANVQILLELKPQAVERQLRRVNESLGGPLDVSGGITVPELEAALIFDASTPASIINSIMQARENARQVREQISSEMWSGLNGLYHFVKQYDHDDLDQELPLDFLSEVRKKISLFKGEMDSTMSHGEEWRFLQIGRHLERAEAMSSMLRAHCGELCGKAEIDDLELLALLRSANAFEAYLKKYTAAIESGKIIEFLVLNPEHPYSVLYSAKRLAQDVATLPEGGLRRKRLQVERVVGRFAASLEFASVDEIVSADLANALKGVNEHCVELHNALHETYIDYPIEGSLPS